MNLLLLILVVAVSASPQRLARASGDARLANGPASKLERRCVQRATNLQPTVVPDDDHRGQSMTLRANEDSGTSGIGRAAHARRKRPARLTAGSASGYLQ